MKKVIFLTALYMACLAVHAQDEEFHGDSSTVTSYKPKEHNKYSGEIKTLSGNGYHSGGFGAISFKQSEFLDKTIVMTGFRGGWIINRSLAIGIEGYGIIPTAEYDSIAAPRQAILLGGYGGMFLEPIFFSNQVIHVTFPISAGAGWLGFHDDWEESNSNYTQDEIIADDVFWYIEPGVAIEINVARHFRMCLGMSKRFTQDLELLASKASDFEKMNYFLTLKFGRF